MGGFREDVRTRAAQKREARAIRSESQSTAAMIFGLVVALCACAVVIMGTIKLGMVMFS